MDKPQKSGAHPFHADAKAVYSSTIWSFSPHGGQGPVISFDEAIQIVMADPEFGEAPPAVLLDILKVSTPEEILEMMRIAPSGSLKAASSENSRRDGHDRI